MASFAAAGLHRLAGEMLRRVGCSEQEADVVADHLVRSNLAGHDSHGVGNLPSYVGHAREGLFVPNQTLRTVLDAGALLQFDAGRGFGARMTAEAVAQAIERARQLGAASSMAARPPRVRAARERVFSACRRHGIRFLEACTPHNVVERIDEGVRVIAGGLEETARIGRSHQRDLGARSCFA